MFNMLRTILLLALLPGIYAHPSGTKSSKEKRCLPNSCPLPGVEKLPYPSGYNAVTCPPPVNDRNPFAIGLAKAAITRRSIIARTANHTKDTDHPPLLQSRDPLRICRLVAYMAPIVNFQAPAGNTPEVLLRRGIFYVCSFAFDTIVESVVTWESGAGNHYSSIAVQYPRRTHGQVIVEGRHTNVHFYSDSKTTRIWHQTAYIPVGASHCLY